MNSKTACRNPALVPSFMSPIHIDSLDHHDMPDPELSGPQAKAVIKRIMAASKGHAKYSRYTGTDNGNAPSEALMLGGSIGCTICTGGLYATLGVVLAAAIATGAAEIGAAAAGVVAAATGLAEGTVVSILSGGGLASVGVATKALCEAMGAC
jgi:hypothetical protein